jgi:hypothetical protein
MDARQDRFWALLEIGGSTPRITGSVRVAGKRKRHSASGQ